MALQKLKRFATSIMRMANYDFCPQYRLYAWLRRPVMWLVIAIVFSILVGLFVGPQGFILAIAFSALLVLGLVWPWISLKGIRCNLVIPPGRMSEDQEVKIVFRVRNFWPLPVYGMMITGDFLQDIQDNEEPIAFSLRKIQAWSETEFSIPITPERRGRLPSGEIRITNGFPFGLIDFSKLLVNPKPALVWPARESMEGNPPGNGFQSSVLGAISDRAGEDGDTIGVRVYRQGDRLRNIHWAQTVRSHQLMVRERQSLTSTTSTVLLDLTPANHAGQGAHSSFEWAIRIAATICDHLHQSRSLVRLYCAGLNTERRPSADNGRGIGPLLDFLADLPKFEPMAEVAGSAPAKTALPAYSGQTFVIRTNRSNRFQNLTDEAKSFVIRLPEFMTEQERASFRETEAFQDESGVVVTAPQLAAGQICGEWKRSFSHATC